MKVNRVWHLMCNHRSPRVHKKNRKRYVRWLLSLGYERFTKLWGIKD